MEIEFSDNIWSSFLKKHLMQIKFSLNLLLLSFVNFLIFLFAQLVKHFKLLLMFISKNIMQILNIYNNPHVIT